MTKGLQFDVQKIIHAANSTNARLIILCSPNNPTGTFLPRSDVRKIIEETTALVVLDEAYVHFAPESQIDLLKTHDRLIILQTFSKAMGAAGLRLGYAMMRPSLARDLAKLKLPYNVNIFTLTALNVILDRWSEVKIWIEVLKKERARLHAGMQALPNLSIYPSAANFLLMETHKRTPSEVFEKLLDQGILVRDVSSYPMLQHALRISVGTPEENGTFLAALEKSV